MSFNQKFFLVGIAIVILISIPLTIYFISKQQEVRSHAEAATVLSIVPADKTGVNVGDEFSLDVMVDPGGKNIVSSMQLQLQYDPTVLEVESITPTNPPFTQVLDGFKTSTQSANVSFATISFGIGDNVTTAVQTATTAATITFKALAATTSPTTVSLVTGADGQTKVLSLATTDNSGENVLSSVNSATVSISNDTNTAVTPTPVPSSTPGPTPIANAPSPTPTNLAPVCTSLNVDRNTSGTAPFSITFSGNGYDSDGTISDATFNFGDGPTQDVTSGNGINTNTVNIPLSHTYQSPGTYTATVDFTDNSGVHSAAVAACSKTIVVAAAPTQQIGDSGNGGSTGDGSNTGGGVVVTASPTPPVSGASTTILGIIGGVAIVVVGGLLFAL